jgi:hypothetical protein
MTRGTLVGIVVVAAVTVVGWHVYVARELGEEAKRMIAERVPGAPPPRAVTVNPLTDIVIVSVGPPEGKSDDPLGALGRALGSAVSGLVAGAMEPAVERELNLRARERFDVYAMLLPYRVRVRTGAET